jgi:uncharacterized membrane protein YebE (DUF533 family)
MKNLVTPQTMASQTCEKANANSPQTGSLQGILLNRRKSRRYLTAIGDTVEPEPP